MRFWELTENQNIAEAFDQPYDWRWDEPEGEDRITATFNTDDDGILTVSFEMIPRNGQEEWHVEFNKNGRQNATNEGDAYRIFATVMEIIGKFIREHAPDRMLVSAEKTSEKSSRINLYRRMLSKYAQPHGYDVSEISHGWKTDFVVTAK